jgi:hypothetical protein
MNTKSLAIWPSQTTMTAFSSTSRKYRTGVIKLLEPPIPPNEETIRRLNDLAHRFPFCTLHKVKKHDLL